MDRQLAELSVDPWRPALSLPFLVMLGQRGPRGDGDTEGRGVRCGAGGANTGGEETGSGRDGGLAAAAEDTG